MKYLFQINSLKKILGVFFLIIAAYAGIEDIFEGRFINYNKDTISYSGPRGPYQRPTGRSVSDANGIAFTNRPIYYGLCAVAGAILLLGVDKNEKKSTLTKEVEVK